MSAIGSKIRARRKELGLGQKPIADALGVTVNTISQYENGKANPSPERYEALAEVLRVDLDFFDIAPDPAPKSEVLEEIRELKALIGRILPVFEERLAELEGKDKDED